MRRVLFWMHLSTGVLVSILVLYFSITGALLAYERPILRAADGRSYRIDPGRQPTPRLLSTRWWRPLRPPFLRP